MLPNSNPKVAVSGGKGFIGSRLVGTPRSYSVKVWACEKSPEKFQRGLF